MRFLFDNGALYVGAKMYDKLGRKGVTTNLVRRDDYFKSDFFGSAIYGARFQRRSRRTRWRVTSGSTLFNALLSNFTPSYRDSRPCSQVAKPSARFLHRFV